MKLTWKLDGANPRGWIAYDEQGNCFVHVGKRAKYNIHHYGEDRYCVFGQSLYDNYCGDLPIDMPEEELKAAAAVMWRLSK